MHALCHHQIIPLGTEVMTLIDADTGETLVAASRRGCCGELAWQVEAKGQEMVQVGERGEAIDAMVDMAFALLGPNPEWHVPGGGYSTSVPHGLRALP